jgi:hypothetical protein
MGSGGVCMYSFADSTSYGFLTWQYLLTLWDRLFGTYRDPSATQVAEYGLEYFRGEIVSGLFTPLMFLKNQFNVSYCF